MRGRVRIAVAGALVAGAAVAGTVALADGGNGIREELTGYEEDPLTISTPASGDFHASLQAKKSAISYRLSYSGFETDVRQAHIHFGGRHQSGGISVWLCGNVPTTPAGVQACPNGTGTQTITGVIKPADVIGPADQGIAAGEFDELLDAIANDVTYVNIHSVQYPGGEIRAQLEPSHDK
jgi:CHRD domain